MVLSASGVDRHGRMRSGVLRGRDAALTCQVGNQSVSQPVRIQPAQVEKSYPNHTKSTSGKTSSRKQKRHQQLMVILTQTEDRPTERRKIIGQSQQQEQDTGGRHESEEKAGFISVTELFALVLLQLLIKPAKTHLDDYIGLRLNGSNISAWSFSRLNDDSAGS